MIFGKQILLLGVLLWSAPLWAEVTETAVEDLYPTREQRQSTLIITKVMGKHHYKEHVLDDDLSAAMLDHYLKSLDPNRTYFTQKDIREFAVYRERLDDALLQARVEPAFAIFQRYRQRVEERIAFAETLLEREFDFTIDESYRFDRSEAPWAADRVALNELWRKRVKNDILSLRFVDKELEEIRTTLRKRYQGIARRVLQVTSDDIYQSFINAYTLSLEPHTSYMSPRVAENFDINMRLSLEGIGAVLSTENEYTVVKRTIPGGPAEQSGEVHPEDSIVGVGQGADGEIDDVIGWRLQDVVERIRGPKGTTVRLRVLPEDAGTNGPVENITLVRDKIQLEDQAAKKRIIEGLEGMSSVRIGVIEVPAFYRDFRGYTQGDKNFRSTTRDVRKLLNELMAEGVDGVVVDLRQNGGGSLIEATDLTGLFITSGPVVQVKHSNGEVEIERDPDPEQVYDGPLAVLVDRYSASASEIFAGAIQDHGRGIIIGEPTFGKGTVQTLIDLDRFVHQSEGELGRLRLTMAQFFRINGGSTQFKGVVPDIIYPTASYSEKQGERSLGNALPWAEIRAVGYRPYRLGSLGRYRELHEQRIRSDAGFRYLTEEQEWLREIRDRTVVSLLEEQRKQEWDEQEELRKTRNKQLRIVMVGLALLSGESEEEGDTQHERDKKKWDDIDLVGLREAVRILADYIDARQPRSAMTH